jgi:hypothetical protein
MLNDAGYVFFFTPQLLFVVILETSKHRMFPRLITTIFLNAKSY